VRALLTIAVYITPFLLIGVAAKIWIKRKGVDLSDVQAEGDPNRKRRPRFFLGSGATRAVNSCSVRTATSILGLTSSRRWAFRRSWVPSSSSSVTMTAPGRRTDAALALSWREAAEAHAARMRDRCPRNAELINVEEIAADN
jgi:hypothetical protein